MKNLTCKVCGNAWKAYKEGSPLVCPKCKTWYWEKDFSREEKIRVAEKRRRRRKELTQEEVRRLFDYNPETGILNRRVPSGARGRVGDPVGNLDSKGYLQAGVCGAPRLLHRVIWLWLYGYWPENELDHINGDRLDNRESNLREVSRSCNQRNRGINKKVDSLVMGVAFHRATQKWSAGISIKGKSRKHLGVHAEFVEAAAYRLAAEQCLNWEYYSSRSTAAEFMSRYLAMGEDYYEGAIPYSRKVEERKEREE